MDRNSVDWKGYIPAVTTPFAADGALDLGAWMRLLEWLDAQGMHGIVVAGTTGEWFSMSDEELGKLFRKAGDRLSGRMTLIAGCNSYTAEAALRKARMASAAGFDGVLLTPPPYVVPSEREIAQFYRDFCDRSPLPVCIYNWPPGTNVDMSLTLLESLAGLDKVVAVKNSTPDPDHFATVMDALHREIRIFGIPTDTYGIELVRSGKADGLMGAGAVLGRDHPDFFNAIWDGDLDRAKSLGARDRKLMEDWFTPRYTGRFGSAQAILKTGLNLRGLPGGYLRRPLLPLEREGVESVRRTLQDLDLAVEDIPVR
mgnify:CR=1 FL=1